MSILASTLIGKSLDTLFIIFNSKDVNQELHTLNGNDLTDPNRKVYNKLHTFHFNFVKI